MTYPWAKLQRRDPRRIAAEAIRLPLHLRVFLLATARAAPGGHAVFDTGEVARTLARVHASTGELLSPYSGRQLRRAVGELVDAGLLAPGSRLPAASRGCLWLPVNVLDIGGGKGVRCHVHRHDHAWVGGPRNGQQVDLAPYIEVA